MVRMFPMENPVSKNRRQSVLDQFLGEVNHALNTLTARASSPSRESPAGSASDHELNEIERKHAAGLMRVNHSGEICAQALYQGQALTAKLPRVREEMARAAREEQDHLAWCEQRISELGSQTSALNPLWYSLSFGIGAVTGLVSDKLSLGFVSATEDQVCEHLKSHLERLPISDQKSRAIVEQMRKDEAQHSHAALKAGGYRFPAPVKKVMSLLSNAMTKTSYHI